jgi:tetraacyldisaccharide 4'-kinase
MTQPSSARSLLLPLTPLYRLALSLRELRLSSGLEPVRRLHSPVVSIGSLSAGGSGKTPLTIALAKALTRRGISVDVLSRGYGRRSRAALRVDPNGAARDFGDEPLLIARESGVPVYVAAQRYQTGLMAEANLSAPEGSHIHLLDDGFQHRQLHRNVNILLLDSRDLHDHLLPAGNLREPLRSMNRATIVAIPADDPELDSRLKITGWQGTIWRLRRRMEIPQIDGPVVAFCGIARSEQFFAGLEASGLHLASRIAFPDHHNYKPHDLDCINDAARSTGATTIVTTEKDNVRLGKRAAGFLKSLELKTARLLIEVEDEPNAIEKLRLSLEPSD